MRSEITFELEEDGKAPLFLNLASVIRREIERGRLKPGEALPGTRALAKSLRIHRNTVDAAYRELVLQGWLVSEPSRGTFVTRDLPEASSSSHSEAKTAQQKTAEAPEAWRPPMLRISDGAPDPRIIPGAELARAFRRALAAPLFLAGSGDDDPAGSLKLRESLAGYLTKERGLTATSERLLVTRGSQMALFLAAHAIFEPGQVIAVEDPGYPLAWSAFRAAGARVAGIPVGAEGLSIDHLIALAEQEPALRAVYVTPHHQYPTTVTMGAGRRLKLLELACRLRLTIIEDDYDHDYRFDGRPVLPLAARTDSGADIIYIGSFSKLFAPGIRLGYVVTNPGRLSRMKEIRQAIDRQGDLPLEYALACLIDDGDLHRHAQKARRIYRMRRDLLAGEIRRKSGGKIGFDLPAGGLAIWLRLIGGIDAALWADQAAKAGLAIAPGCSFALKRQTAQNAFRFGYASLDETELRRAVDLLMLSMPA